MGKCVTVIVIYSEYRRHNANQRQSVADAFRRLEERFPGVQIRVALTGSGVKLISEELKLPFVQEVVANSIVLRSRYPQVRTAIELGGQDAKIIFFHQEKEGGPLAVSDMRMNNCQIGPGPVCVSRHRQADHRRAGAGTGYCEAGGL